MALAVAATAPFGADVLERLAATHEIDFVLTRPDKPKGRGRRVAPPPAKETAARLGIPVLQPERLDASVELPADSIVVVAYGLLIPPVLLGPLLTDLIERRREHENAFMRLAELSAREREVLALVARGLTTAAIGQKLVISPETARTHIQNILGKLELHSRLEAATFVIENGLLDHLTVTPATRTPATA